jgi:transcriptional regulator with PAS, ATPase and Fis domain
LGRLLESKGVICHNWLYEMAVMTNMAPKKTLPNLGNEFLALLNAEPVPRVVVLPDYTIAAVNESYRTRFPAPGSVLGQTCHFVSHGFDKPCNECGESCPISEAQKTRLSQKVLHIHQTSHGQEHVEIETLPVYDKTGKLVCYIETINPVSGASAEPSAQGLVGQSRSFTRMLDQIGRVAPTAASVLLLGETGTGKELAAHAIHDRSKRADKPFVTVECAGLAENLFESELFGHEKGAFTGAVNRKTGLIETAAGGTLFLDEIGDVPLSMQVKLLRVLETGLYRRVGGIEPIRADIRLISATHRDLTEMVKAGLFRQDLYFRVSTFPLKLPSLSERRDDLGVLAQSLLRRIAPERKLELSVEALACLKSYAFPGNIRELRNMLERASILVDGETILPEHLPDACPEKAPASKAASLPFEQVMPLEEMERRYLRWALARLPGSRREQSIALGVSERTLFRKLGGLDDTN